MINIAIQSFLRPALTAVPHCQDYAVSRLICSRDNDSSRF